MVNYYLDVYHSNEQNYSAVLLSMKSDFPTIYGSNNMINSNEFCSMIRNETDQINECNRINAQILSMGLKAAISSIEMHIQNIKYFIIVSSNLSSEEYLKSLKNLEFSPMIDLKAKYLNNGYDNITIQFIGAHNDFLNHQLVVSKIRFVVLVMMVIILLVLVLGIYIGDINRYMVDIRRIVSVLPSNVLFLRLIDLASGLKKLS
jgi:hypothetical protein